MWPMHHVTDASCDLYIGGMQHFNIQNNLGLYIAAVGSWTREIKVPLLLVQNQLNKIIPQLNPNN